MNDWRPQHRVAKLSKHNLVPTSDIRIISISIIININISFLCSSGNARTKNSRVSVVYSTCKHFLKVVDAILKWTDRHESTGPRISLAKTQWSSCVIMFLIMSLWFSRSHYKEKQHSHSHRHNHNHKKMVDHFLMIMIMLIIRALMIMFLDVPTKT